MTQPTPAQIAAGLARVTALFQLRTIAAHMGRDTARHAHPATLRTGTRILRGR